MILSVDQSRSTASSRDKWAACFHFGEVPMETNVLVTGDISRDDSRPQRFAKTWLGLSLATLVGIGSTVELVAMPIPAPGAQLLGPTLIQQSPKPQGGAEQPGRRAASTSCRREQARRVHRTAGSSERRTGAPRGAVQGRRGGRRDRTAAAGARRAAGRRIRSFGPRSRRRGPSRASWKRRSRRPRRRRPS